MRREEPGSASLNALLPPPFTWPGMHYRCFSSKCGLQNRYEWRCRIFCAISLTSRSYVNSKLSLRIHECIHSQTYPEPRKTSTIAATLPMNLPVLAWQPQAEASTTEESSQKGSSHWSLQGPDSWDGPAFCSRPLFRLLFFIPGRLPAA